MNQNPRESNSARVLAAPSKNQKMDDRKRAGAKTLILMNTNSGFVQKIMLEKDIEWNRLWPELNGS
jgi:hypothetical protein